MNSNHVDTAAFDYGYRDKVRLIKLKRASLLMANFGILLL